MHIILYQSMLCVIIYHDIFQCGISLYEIITAVDENLDQTQCAGSMNCLKDKPCTTHHVWTGLNKIIQDYMKSITIEDVITNQVIHNLHDARESKTHVS